MCHCDFYKYNDFIPMLIVGSIGALNFAIFPLNQLQALTLLIIYILYALVIAFLLPQKEIQPLKYPPQLLIQNIDQFQEFLMTNPQERKLITMVKATCDFCAIQVAELNQIPLDILSSRLRILDLSIMKIDPILGMTLNISPDELDKVPVPSTRVYDAGMEVELKEGVLSSPEIQALLL
ncbi:MAG: hypothetical protein IH840_17015 [Candidatus Heimdallarchaeota archaeon]|nr:hypothetical protein [Candidatus Heimdallarchaeota archaeon]